MAQRENSVEERVRLRAERGDFFGQLLALAKKESTDIHEDFIRELTSIAASLRELFLKENVIAQLNLPAAQFWRESRGRRVAFIDGGVARIDVPSAAPMGIRVGSYAVRIGDESQDREQFSVELALVDELYSANSQTYEDLFEDVSTMTDAARIAAETSAATKILARERDLDAVFIHGPLVNPVAPYGTPGFPSFSATAAANLTGLDENAFANPADRHFVRVYKEILRMIAASRVPVVGVVERPKGRAAVLVRAYLNELHKTNRLSADIKNDFLDKLEEYRLTDMALFSVILARGEYTKPFPIDRQQPENKWPNEWIPDIRRYPAAFTSFLKSSDASDPFRLEFLEPHKDDLFTTEAVMKTAQLLPNYGFPVGLDIADKFSKVPAWMSRGVQNQHAVILLKQALKTGEPKTIDYAKRVLAARGRDWLFRPKA